MYSKEDIINMWKKYHISFKDLFDSSFNNMFDTFESEVLYSIVRAIKPQKILEFGPNTGFTSSILLKAMKANKTQCDLFSFDLLDSSKNLDYSDKNILRKLIVGDIKETCQEDDLSDIDFMFIDADHGYEFGEWYCKNILSKLRKNVLIQIHDWEGFDFNYDEHLAVKEHGIAKNIVRPVINLMDYVMNNKQHSMTPDKIVKNYKLRNFSGDRSPSQILERL